MRHRGEETRTAILTAAHVAFYRNGYTRVGMSEIAAAAGVTKRTLYHHFDSKDSLLEAMLERQTALSAETFRLAVDRPAGDAAEMVARIFDDLFDWAGQDRWTGPGITRLAMELGDLPGHPAMRFAARHKASIEALFAERLRSFDVADPDRLARAIWLLVEGAMMLTLIHKDREYVRAGAAAAAMLLAEA